MNARALAIPLAIALVYAGAMIALSGFSAPSEAQPGEGSEGAAAGIPPEFFDLAERDYPAAFEKHFGEADAQSFARAIEMGQKVYAREGCFHCHTQRVSYGIYNMQDVNYWGAPIEEHEYAAPWHATPMLGQRRVGPDLGREANRRSNDWHAAHLYSPDAVVPGSIMPAFPWLFDNENGVPIPNEEGMGVIAYLQSLGSGVDEDRR